MVEPVSNLTYLMQHIAAIMGRQADQILQERLGIGMSQLKILMLLQHEPNVQQRTLGDRLGQTEASISRQIKLMQGKGYLAVAINPKSRREHIAVPTPKGLKITEAAKDVLLNYYQPLAEVLGEKQQKQLQETLKVLHDYTCAPNKPFACDHFGSDASWIDALSSIAAMIKREK